MPVAKLIAPTTKQEIPKLRVAAYCRVSSNSADQRNSFATQEHVYTKYIAEKQEWELVDIFADEGLSGMKADNRPEFQRMIRMCELHQIDLILTKSVSRFARNVKEALSYTRKLKQANCCRRCARRGRFCCNRGRHAFCTCCSQKTQGRQEAGGVYSRGLERRRPGYRAGHCNRRNTRRGHLWHDKLYGNARCCSKCIRNGCSWYYGTGQAAGAGRNF